MGGPAEEPAGGTGRGAVVELPRAGEVPARPPQAEVLPPAEPRPRAIVWLAPFAPAALPRNPFWPPPILGSLAVIFGLVALFKAPLLFGPLGAGFGLLALLRGQFWFAAVGGLTGLAGLVAAPAFWAILGASWLLAYLFG
jgi:hypothetical protein